MAKVTITIVDQVDGSSRVESVFDPDPTDLPDGQWTEAQKAGAETLVFLNQQQVDRPAVSRSK